MHLSDETLRAYLDLEPNGAGQVALQTTQAVAGHLRTCGMCRERLNALQGRVARVAAQLATLDPSPADAPRPAAVALAQFNARKRTAAPKETPTMFQRIFSPRVRPAWIGLTALLVFVIALSFQPVRTWAGSLLSLFRVQTVVVLPVDNTRLSLLTGNDPLAKEVSQLLSSSIKVTKEPGKPQPVADAAAASQAAGFTVRLPASRTDAPQLSVQGAGAFEFVADAKRAQAVLKDAGLGDVQLPASLDGAQITVNIPAGVTAGYGDCPKLQDGEQAKGSVGRTMANCIMLAEMPSPTVHAPADLNLEQLAEIGLQSMGMTAEQAQAYSQTVDWTSTLVVPIPRNGASYTQVTVDGVQGDLIQRPMDDAPQYLLVWVKDGIIYAIGGLGNDTSAALAMANSLK